MRVRLVGKWWVEVRIGVENGKLQARWQSTPRKREGSEGVTEVAGLTEDWAGWKCKVAEVWVGEGAGAAVMAHELVHVVRRLRERGWRGTEEEEAELVERVMREVGYE